MPRRIPDEGIAAILAAVQQKSGEAVSRAEIAEKLTPELATSTLQFRLKYLVDRGRLIRQGQKRAAKYSLPGAQKGPPPAVDSAQTGKEEPAIPLSAESEADRRYLRQSPAARRNVGYDRRFLDSYRPNVSFYLSPMERERLEKTGRQTNVAGVAGTYAREILNRLLIDLSWNSSRLEGNTYSLLDTKRLIEFGKEAEGRNRREAQMIMNHKAAIEFLVDTADDIGFDRHTILNLHGILAQNLLQDEGAAGRLRRIPVGIERSTFHPLEVPQLIDECFRQLLATAAAIHDPFEQALFVMVQLPYLQPFDDVNKRVSRLAANIPFIKGNLSPLSFTDVPLSLYTDAILSVYELEKVDLMKEVFLWAYGRSAEMYAAVRQSLGEPDPFRFRYGAALRQVVAETVRGCMDRERAVAYVAEWTGRNIETEEREHFREEAENDLLNLHEGNFARYQIRPSEFAAWEAVWKSRPSIS